MKAGDTVKLLDRPRSLLRFLAIWLAAYLVPAMLSVGITMGVLLADSGKLGQYLAAILSFLLLPGGLAVSHWLLMGKYLRRPARWSTAIFVSALLSQFIGGFIPDATL